MSSLKIMGHCLLPNKPLLYSFIMWEMKS